MLRVTTARNGGGGTLIFPQQSPPATAHLFEGTHCGRNIAAIYRGEPTVVNKFRHSPDSAIGRDDCGVQFLLQPKQR
jgi:hypothetical protein